jgi:hypothetical protein
LSGFNGENILLWDPKTYTRDDWDLRGGHRVWLSRPKADESEETYRPDNEPCKVELQEHGFTITAPIDPITQIQRGFKVSVIDDERLEIDNFITNCGEMLFSCGVWGISCTVPTEGTEYMIPVGDESDWDAFNYVIFRTWAGNGTGGVNDQQWQFTEDSLMIKPMGLENKRMIQAPKGTIAMLDPTRQQVFAKQIDFDIDATYPMNTNLASYIGPDNFMVEMETMGPEKTLKPQKTAHHLERWTLKSVETLPKTAKALEQILS